MELTATKSNSARGGAALTEAREGGNMNKQQKLKALVMMGECANMKEARAYLADMGE
jgi:hypothetical protein